MSQLAESYFFRDPPRPTFADSSFFFSPADGVVLYQEVVEPQDPTIAVKGAAYSLKELTRDPSLDGPAFVVGIFMTFFDVHINRIPYPGRLSYQLLDPLDTYNHPMLDVEKAILEEMKVAPEKPAYLRYNERMLNRIDSPELGGPYYILQIADYDVDSIVPFGTKQNEPCAQGDRFSQIRFGSQVDLIIPVRSGLEIVPIQPAGVHVEAGVDPLARVIRKNPDDTLEER